MLSVQLQFGFCRLHLRIGIQCRNYDFLVGPRHLLQYRKVSVYAKTVIL